MGRGFLLAAVAAGLLLGSGVARADEPSDPAPEAAEGTPVTDTAPAADAARSPEPTAPASGDPGDPPVDGPTEEPADEPLLKVRANGFVDMRWTGGYASVARLMPSHDVPHLQNLTEGNVQLKLDWGGGRAQAYTDVSLVWQRGWMFWGKGTDGSRTRLADHDVPNLHPAAIVAEGYVLGNLGDRLNVTVGKKRVLWGPALAWNPSDLINPPKDPTDPTLQRAGPWLARVELPLDTWTFSAVAAAKTTLQYGGLPAGLVTYPDFMAPKPDAAAHWTVAARVYKLAAETDINAMVYLSNLYNDAFQDKLRAAVTMSRVFLDSVEVHVEVLGQRGSARLYAEGDCVADLAAAIACVATKRMPVGYSKVHDDDLRIKALAGVRWQFGENAALSAEYLYNGDGLNQWQYRNLVQGLSLAQSLPAGAPLPFAVGAQAADPGTPQKFAFEPLRRHYLFLTYLHPQLADDFTINAVVIAGLADLSGQLVPQLTWSAREWLNVTAGAFVTLPGFESLGVQAAGRTWTEYGMQPVAWRAFVAARAFF
ncbi:MAG: hypothetical protein FJ100_12865 [Deltaproteobacteria bacterium]|nr:hypothetical protein [Deltaproteobacteria bacterium]